MDKTQNKKPKHTKVLPVLAAGVLAAALLAGCGSSASAQTTPATSEAPAGSTAASQQAGTPAAPGTSGTAEVTEDPGIGLDAAKKAALQDAGFSETEASFVSGHAEPRGEAAAYELRFVAGDKLYRYEVAAEDGSVLEASSRKVEEAIPAEGQLSIEEAKSAALADAGVSAGDAVFTRVRLETRGDTAVYDLEFFAAETGYHSALDATTGEVLASRQGMGGRDGGRQERGENHGGRGANRPGGEAPRDGQPPEDDNGPRPDGDQPQNPPTPGRQGQDAGAQSL